MLLEIKHNGSTEDFKHGYYVAIPLNGGEMRVGGFQTFDGCCQDVRAVTTAYPNVDFIVDCAVPDSMDIDSWVMCQYRWK